ncbi:MAG: hypothetical protein VKQ33_00635 [Candidatus Sericytochromatia bacterium]|nr:hypothetical protein [Candidatus Sericytochromatia bacterium]
MAQVGGDSQNTMPVAINAGLAARQIAKLTPVDPGAAKFSMDAFKQTLSNPGVLAEGTVKNLPLADALAQQSLFTRLAARIPFVRGFLGPDFILNEAIGKLGKEALGGLSKAHVTRIALEGGDVAGKLAKAGLAPEIAKEIAAKTAERAAAIGGSVVGGVGRQVASGAMDDLAKQALGMTMKKGFTQASEAAIKKALQDPNAYEALKQLGFYAKDAKALVAKAAGAGAETVAKAAATEAATVAGKGATAGGARTVKGFFGKLLSGAKGNFVVAGVFSLASNAIQLAQGQLNVQQFLGLSAVDTAAYGAIGWGSAAAGAALGTALFPGVGTAAGFVIGLGLGFVGGAVYEKVVRNPLKALLGAGGGAQAADGGYRASDQAGVSGPGSAGYAIPAPTPGVDLTYEEALRQIERMGSR